MKKQSQTNLVHLVGLGKGPSLTDKARQGGLFPPVFPVIIGILLWGGLYLRDERLLATC